MNDDEPLFPARSDREKEASAWWFRQLCTTLIIANAGGVIAVSSFAANTENVAIAALIAYPSTSLFLAGAVIAAAGIILQFLYVSLRLEAVGEFDRARNDWRAKKGLKAVVSLPPTVAFLVLTALTLSSMALSSLYFYRGAKQASLSTSALACASLADRGACSDSILIFGSVDAALQARARRAVISDTRSMSEPSVSIHPDALPSSDDAGIDRETRFLMRRAAESAGRTADCGRVELVNYKPSPEESFSVTCSNESSLTVRKFTRGQLLDDGTELSLGRATAAPS